MRRRLWPDVDQLERQLLRAVAALLILPAHWPAQVHAQEVKQLKGKSAELLFDELYYIKCSYEKQF